MRFDLTDMRLFLTVVECGSLTQGARTLHRALASVSDRIAGLEEALGELVALGLVNSDSFGGLRA